MQLEAKKIEARKKLAASQLELIRALAGQRDAPDKFDNSRVRAAADAMFHKRARSVAHAWPRLTRALGDSFYEMFAGYARVTPIPSFGGALIDGRLFVRELTSAGKLPDEGRLEAIAFDARFAVRPNKIITRRFAFRSARLYQSRRIVIALRLPLIGERWIKIPIKIL
jgi:hypothetical protein